MATQTTVATSKVWKGLRHALVLLKHTHCCYLWVHHSQSCKGRGRDTQNQQSAIILIATRSSCYDPSLHGALCARSAFTELKTSTDPYSTHPLTTTCLAHSPFCCCTGIVYSIAKMPSMECMLADRERRGWLSDSERGNVDIHPRDSASPTPPTTTRLPPLCVGCGWSETLLMLRLIWWLDEVGGG